MKASKAVFLVFLILMSLCFINTQPVKAAENSWATMADMPTPRLGPGVAVVNEKIYAIGGGNENGYLNTNEEYDPATNTWATKKPMPTPRASFGIAVYQNKIYCIGGGIELTVSLEEVTGVNEVYDPSTDSWTTKTPSPTQVDLYASAIFDNKIFIIGGTVIGSISNLTQIYHPETDTWTSGTPVPNATWGAAAGAITGVAAPKRIYVIGGNPTLNLNQVYDPEKDVWTTGAPMPTNRYGLGVAVVNDILYAIGGPGIDAMAKNEQYIPFGFSGTVPQQSEPFPTTWIIATMAIIAIVVAVTLGVAIYRRRSIIKR